jgi:hypothetical protein
MVTEAQREVKLACSRAWYYANKERALNYQKSRDPAKLKIIQRRSVLKRKYGLTLEAWDAMFEAQGKLCIVCDTSEPRSKAGWQVDHCHVSGAVRGILCSPCNLMLGLAEDDPSTLERAAAYLRASKLSEK